MTEGTLANWRYRDKKADRKEAPPGFPAYQKFGRAVRYRLEGDAVMAAQAILKSERAARHAGTSRESDAS